MSNEWLSRERMRACLAQVGMTVLEGHPREPTYSGFTLLWPNQPTKEHYLEDEEALSLWFVSFVMQEIPGQLAIERFQDMLAQADTSLLLDIDQWMHHCRFTDETRAMDKELQALHSAYPPFSIEGFWRLAVPTLQGRLASPGYESLHARLKQVYDAHCQSPETLLCR